MHFQNLNDKNEKGHHQSSLLDKLANGPRQRSVIGDESSEAQKRKSEASFISRLSQVQPKSSSLPKEKGSSTFYIKTKHLEKELDEVKQSALDNNDLAVNVTIGPIAPNYSLIGKNPFISPEYWLSKGYKIQVGQNSKPELSQGVRGSHQFHKVIDMSDHALDYYYQGLRIQPRHFGCCFNVATIFLRKNKYKNAQKWFHMATKLDRDSKVAFLGLAISTLKLGQHQSCIQQIDQRPGLHRTKTRKEKGCSSTSINVQTHRSSQRGPGLHRSSEDLSSRSRSQSFSRTNRKNAFSVQHLEDTNQGDKGSHRSGNKSSR